MVENWKEIYENAAGLGKAGNSMGGLLFNLVMVGGNTDKQKIRHSIIMHHEMAVII
jgi:hypothetical protein